MSNLLDGIPVLTDVIDQEREAAPPGRPGLLLGELEAQLALAIHEAADELVHNACREMEALLLEQVSDRLRAELPALVARIVEEHFRMPARKD
jgi:hypothetical protein